MEMRTTSVGIAGGSGSGKSTLVRQLSERLGLEYCRILRHDDYYRDLSAVPQALRATLDFDDPGQLETSLLVRHLDELRAGRPVEAPLYDFSTHTRRPETRRLEPAPILLVEGILLFADPELARRFDLRVFLEAPAELCFRRRLDRDLAERGRTPESVRRQYETTVLPAYRAHVEPSRREADLIIDTSRPLASAVESLARELAVRAGLPGPAAR